MKQLEQCSDPTRGRRPPQPEQESHDGVLAGYDLLRHALDAMHEFVFVVDENREILFCNRAALAWEALCEDHATGGRARLGDLLSCVHVGGSKGGCGTAEACRQCGAHRAIKRSPSGLRQQDEWHMLRSNDGRVGALDLRVEAVPFDLDGRHLVLLTAVDIGPDKRRQMLERLFFHDVLNSVTSMYGLCCLLKSQGTSGRDGLLQDVLTVAEKLVAEIRSQQTLQMAEAGELRPVYQRISSLAFLLRTTAPFETSARADGRTVCVSDTAVDVELETDRTLLGRVLANMLKNALEATERGGVVSVGCRLVDGEAHFWVHNPGFMATDLQVQVFHRSFSTKGPARGVGTYSIKILTENYLGGRASFSSDRETGTTFTVCLPLERVGNPATGARVEDDRPCTASPEATRV